MIRDKFKYTETWDEVCLNQEKIQRDLFILVSHDLFPRSHIYEILRKANQRNHG